MIIGITGKMHSGKDSLYKYVLAGLGFDRLALADPVKAGAWFRESADPMTFRLGNPRAFYQFFGQQKTDDVRHTLQYLGTDYVRDAVDPCYWSSILLEEYRVRYEADPKARIAVTDVRFEDEAKALAGDMQWITAFYAARDGNGLPYESEIRWRMTHNWLESHPEFGTGLLPLGDATNKTIRVKRNTPSTNTHVSETQEFVADIEITANTLLELKWEGEAAMLMLLPELQPMGELEEAEPV